MRYRIISPYSFYAIVSLPIAVFLFTEYTIEAFGYHSLSAGEWALAERPAGDSFQALAARYRFYAFTFAFYVVSLACIIFCVIDFSKRFKRRSLNIIGGAIALIAVVVWLVLVLLVSTEAAHSAYELLDGDLFRLALGDMPVNSSRFGTVFNFYEFLVEVDKYVTMAVVALLISGAVAIACSHPVPLPRSRRPLLTRLQRQAGDFKRYVYLSSVFMVFGVLHTHSWMSLPAYAITDESLRQHFEALVDAIVFFYSMSFSLIIVVFAVPGLLVMRENSERLISGTLEPTAEDYHQTLLSRMKGLGFGLFSVEGMQSMLAVLAPVIAGSLDLTKLLSG